MLCWMVGIGILRVRRQVLLPRLASGSLELHAGAKACRSVEL